MKTFLSLKHWQLFLLIYCLPFALLIGMIGYLVIASGGASEMLLFYKLFLLGSLISMGIYFYWLWSLASFFSKNNSSLSEKTKLKFLLILSFLCYVAVNLLLYFNIDSWTLDGNMKGYFEIIMFITVLGLVFSVLYLYCLYSVAKIFKTTKLGKTASWADFILEFLLLWFYPIGIWIIQPQANKMLKREM
ncbi:MAG: SoxR reducing system RseC family protein [Aequorivita sp.]